MRKTHVVENTGLEPMLVFAELEAQDYWLQPGESFTLEAEVEASDDDFIIEKNEDGITVWPSVGMGYISVFQDRQLLECGHQRPAGWP